MAQLDIKLANTLDDLNGVYLDEITLLTNLAIKYFQCFLEMAYVEQEECNNPHMRFYGTLSLNDRVVGKGYGGNKKQVKLVASRLALQNIAPTLYKQWKATLKTTSTLVESPSKNSGSDGALSDFEMVPLSSTMAQAAEIEPMLAS